MNVIAVLCICLVVLMLLAAYFAIECDQWECKANEYELNRNQLIDDVADKQIEIDVLTSENEKLKRMIKGAQSLLCSTAVDKKVSQFSEADFASVLAPPPPQGEPAAYV